MTASVPLVARRERILWAATALALSIAAAAGFLWRRASPPDAPMPIVRFDVAAPPASTFDWSQPISPDERTIALVARTEGKSRLWVRPIDSASMRPLPGTEDATRPFWSPDSRHIGYLGDGDVKEVGIDGSAPRPLFRARFGQVPLGVVARFDVARDGRFLIREGTSDIAIRVILNWAEQLKSTMR